VICNNTEPYIVTDRTQYQRDTFTLSTSHTDYTKSATTTMISIIFTFVPWILLLSAFFIDNWCTRELFLGNIKMYVTITTTPCFGVITIIRERTICKAVAIWCKFNRNEKFPQQNSLLFMTDQTWLEMSLIWYLTALLIKTKFFYYKPPCWCLTINR